jgi:hypothetical protein
LLKLAVSIAVVYAVVAIFEGSWWRPAVSVAIVVAVTALFNRMRSQHRARPR